MKKNRPLITFVIPAFNKEYYIVPCIESILAQEYIDYEIVLVDDGSNDRTSQICDLYASINNVKIIHKKNGGLVSARIAGCKLACGKYIACVDADDWIDKKYILVLKKVIEEQNYPDIICFNFYEYKNEKIKETKEFSERLYNKKDIIEYIYPKLIHNDKAEYFSPSLCNKIFKNDLYINNQIKINKKITIGEDGACLIPCVYNAKRIVSISNCLYYYRINDYSMTNNKREYMWNYPLYIYKQIKEMVNISEYGFEEQLYRKTTHDIFTVIVSKFNSNKSYFNTKSEILDLLCIAEYSECIEKASFNKYSLANLMLFVLKKRLIFVTYIYYIFKKLF